MPVDRIIIRDLRARCIIGTNDEERREKQDVTINLALSADLGDAGTSDKMDDTVDYRALKKKILALVESSHFFLVEALAQAVADVCLGEPKIRTAHVQIEKPSALRFARSVGVRISRTRKERA
jgi:D-erythro-7,8-dihydroneopterin triphosphate epimerase